MGTASDGAFLEWEKSEVNSKYKTTQIRLSHWPSDPGTNENHFASPTLNLRYIDLLKYLNLILTEL